MKFHNTSIDITNGMYRVTNIGDSAVKYQWLLSRYFKDQQVKISAWYQWAHGFVDINEDLEQHQKFIACDIDLGCFLGDVISEAYDFIGEGWKEKDQNRIQKDFNKNGIQRILENNSNWRIEEASMYINAPFRIDIVDKQDKSCIIKSDIKYQGQILP